MKSFPPNSSCSFFSLAQCSLYPKQYHTSHIFITSAPAPNSAAAPTAPVFIGAAIALELALALAMLEATTVAADAVMIAEDGTGMPLVKGTLEAEWAPEKAAVVIVAVTLGVAAVAAGLRTLWRGS